MIEQSPYPVIICGDFNDTPSSYTYHQLSEGLIDAFKESGNGIGHTYGGALPSFRIDYILHDERFKSTRFNTIRSKFSDHYPITTSLKLQE
jgi:endonuclease/exonuclease/phosphatase family metal-dependent hydrolase